MLLRVLPILQKAGASVAGAAIAIEKGFQGGGDRLRGEGMRIESLALIDDMSDGKSPSLISRFSARFN